MKLCSSCNLTKSKSLFYKESRAYDGLMARCKSCNIEKKKKWMLENKEKVRDYKRTSAEKINRACTEAGTLRHKIRCSNYYYNNRLSLLDDAKRYRRTISGWTTDIYSSMKQSSKQRGHTDFEFRSKDEFIAWILNREILFIRIWDDYVLSGFEKLKRPSIDRIDNKKGYRLSNIRLVTWHENVEAWNDERRKKVI